MAAAQVGEFNDNETAPCVEEGDDYPEEDMEQEEDDFTVQLGATYCCRKADGSYRDGEVVKLRMNRRAGREEYLVHYVGLSRRQAEWVDKTRLMLSNPTKEDDMENGTDQKITEIEKATQNQRSEKDEPETKKAKVYTSAVVPKNKEITCLLCSELYKDPVMVQCGHSFCRSCINEAWANCDSFSCPDCNKVITERNLTTNFALDYILKTTVGDAAKHVENVKTSSALNCREHDEQLKLYCKDDGILGCIICRDSLKHPGHTFLPIADAVEMYRAKLSTVVSPIEEAWKKASEQTAQQSQKVEQLQNTVMECRQHIWSEFGNLYSFLKERKKKLLQQLEEQGPGLLKEMEIYAARLKQNRDSIKESLVVASEKMYETDPATFLDGMDNFVKTSREQLEAVNLTLSGIPQKKLCRGTFKGPVQYFTWKQMKSIIPVPDHEEQPELPRQEEVPESSSDTSVINDMVPDNGQQPKPPGQEKVPESSSDASVINDLVPDNGHQPEPPGQEKVPESASDASVINDSVPDNGQQPKPPGQEKVPESPINPPVVCVSAPEYEQQPVPPGLEDVLEFPKDLPVIKNLVPECEKPPRSQEVPESPVVLPLMSVLVPEREKKPEPPMQNKISNSPMILPLIQNDHVPREVWIFGNGYMTAAKHRAQHSPLGLNLGFKLKICTIHWFEINNCCSNFFDRLEEARKVQKSPDVVVFHSGSSDLESEDFYFMIKELTEGLTKAKKLFPKTVFILSGLYPKVGWQWRKRFYDTFYYLGRMSQFYVLKHPELGKKLAFRNATQDVNDLMDNEMNLFIIHIQKALKKNFPAWAESFMKPSFGRKPAKAFAGNVKKNVQQIKVVERKEAPQASAGPSVAENVQHLTAVERKEAPESSAGPSGPKEVWILGDIFIFRVALHAENIRFYINAGFDQTKWKIHWLGKTNRWINLLADLHNSCRKLGMPNIVFLHLGSYDVGTVSFDKLVTDIRYDIGRLVKLFPKTYFIYSTILPRGAWISNGLEEDRKMLNQAIGDYVEKLGYGLAKHETLEKVLLSRFQQGRTHCNFTLQENDIFFGGISVAIENAAQQADKMVILNQEPKKQVIGTGDTLTVVIPGTDPLVKAEEDKEEEQVKNPEPQPETNEEAPSIPENPALPNTSGVKQIWIVGNSYICRAARQANGSSLWSNMGFELEKWKVHWMGQVAMRWEALLPELKKALPMLGAPNIIFIHIGDNDLGFMPYEELRKAIARDLSYLAQQFPKTKFIFSSILPRAEWLAKPLEQNRKDVNHCLARHADMLGFHVVVHDDIEETALLRFKAGGTNVISDIEYNMFMKSITHSVKQAMLEV